MSEDSVDLDPADRALAVLLSTERGRQNSYPLYDVLLARPGLHRSAMGWFVATRYRDCAAILKDRRLGHAPTDAASSFATAEQYEDFKQRYPRIAERAPVMLELNPPEHTRMRALVSKAFTPKVITDLRPRIASIVDELLQSLPPAFDVVPQIGIQLPALVISELLGIPREGQGYVIPHVRRIIQALDAPLPKSQNLEEVYRATELVEEYFTSIIRRKRANPGEDLISNLITARDGGGQLSEAELISTILLLFVAGYESSTNLMSNGFYALLTHPHVVEELQRDPDAIQLAVPAAVLAAELRAPASRGVVALRGRYRWIAAQRPVPVPEAVGEPLRENGVYLVTGGFGGLGLVLARRLAATGLCPRLILIGRGGGHGRDEAIAEMTAFGAQVHAAACDVTDATELRAVLAAATSRFGAVNGVFHLAGKSGGRMIAFRDNAQAAEVLAPKVAGTLNLEAVFAGAPRLDFVVYYSSRAGTDGLVGGADYAAANAFLDAMSGESRLAGGQVLSVGWPVFNGVGMAVDSGYDVAGLASQVARMASNGTAKSARPSAKPTVKPAERPTPVGDKGVIWEAELRAATHWALDEHRVGRIPLLPGTAYLDLAVQAFRERVAPEPGGAIVLEDVVFRAPFYDVKARRMRLTFRERGGSHEFTVTSRPVDDPEAAWVTHATGRIARSAEARPEVDLPALRARLELAGAESAGKTAESAFTLGPRWRNVVAQWTAGDERLVAVELPAPFHADLDAHAMHPALLDTVTASIRNPGEGATVPFLYRRLVHHADLPAAFVGHVRRTESAGVGTIAGDLDLIDPEGRVLASISGFTMRAADLAEAMAADTRQPRDEPTTDDPPSAEAVMTDGLDPEAGAELLLALLSAQANGHFLVRPHQGGVPVSPGVPPSAEVRAAPTQAVATGTTEAMRPQSPIAPPASEGIAPSAGENVEERVRRLWAEVLGVSSVTDDQDFFEAGGHSLTAIEIMSKVREMFGVELSIGLLLDTRTFGALVRVLLEHGAT